MRKKTIVTVLSVIAIIVLVVVGVVIYFFKNSATGYHKESGKVFYQVYGISRSEVIGADAKSFDVMSMGDGQLGADKNQIYLMQSAFPADLDRASFQLLPDNTNWKRFFSRDKNRVYYATLPLVGSQPDTFTILEDGFSKDQGAAYYQEKKLEDVNVTNFKSIGANYATDGNKVFYTQHAIKGADAATFSASPDENYARDKNNLYNFEVPGKIVDDEFIPNK